MGIAEYEEKITRLEGDIAGIAMRMSIDSKRLQALTEELDKLIASNIPF